VPRALARDPLTTMPVPPATQSTPAAPPVSGRQATLLQNPPTSNPAISGFHIRNQYSGKCLVAPSSSEDSLVRQVKCDPKDSSQYWQLPDPRDDNPDVFQIHNVKSRNCIASDIKGFAAMVMCGCTQVDRWQFLEQGAIARPKNPTTGACLISEHDDVGDQARLSACQASPGQYWDIY
jgi:hypothetical protein